MEVRMRHFSKELSGWILQNNEHLEISYIETKGEDLEDFLANCMISLTDWHGNEGPDWSLNDLSAKDYKYIVEMFREFLEEPLMNDKGFSLISTMIALGIMSIVMLGLMQIVNHALLISITADQKNNLTSIVGSTTGTALNEISCTLAVTQVSQTMNDPFHFGAMHDGADLTAYGLTVKSIVYANSVLVAAGYEGTKVYYGTITLTATSQRKILGGSTFAPRVIASVYLTTNPSGTIIACSPVMTPPPVKAAATSSEIKTLAFDAEPKVCENFLVKIKCPDTQKISVTQGSYGANCDGVAANYGMDIVKALCNGQSNCDFTAGNIDNCTSQGIFVDPAYNCPKSFHMSYYCS